MRRLSRAHIYIIEQPLATHWAPLSLFRAAEASYTDDRPGAAAAIDRELSAVVGQAVILVEVLCYTRVLVVVRNCESEEVADARAQ